MRWLALLNAAGEPAMKPGEEVLFACHAADDPTRFCLLLGHLRRATGAAEGPFGQGYRLHSTWDGKPVEPALVPYAFARPIPPEPKR